MVPAKVPRSALYFYLTNQSNNNDVTISSLLKAYICYFRTIKPPNRSLRHTSLLVARG